jgi:hypothetical protein
MLSLIRRRTNRWLSSARSWLIQVSQILAAAAAALVFSGSLCHLLFTSGNMASDIAVFDGVIKVFNDMKLSKSSTPEDVKKCKKAVLFCLSEDKKNILEEGKEVLVGDVGQTVDDPYATFVKMQTDEDWDMLFMKQPTRPTKARRRTWCSTSGRLSVHSLRAK